MPFRFRKSVKLGKGLKLNISKSGISTSIGKAGATVNFGKRGVRTTVGLPGTGLSHSTLHHSDSTSQPKSSPTFNTTPAKQTMGSGCIAFPFRIIGDLIASISNPQTRRSSIIIIGSIMGSCVLCFGGFSILGALSKLSLTSTPTPNPQEMMDKAMTGVWDSFTQTAAALPTLTPTITKTSAPTNTLLPTNTPLPTYTPRPANTATLAPPAIPTLAHPAGTSGQCVDGTYTYAQHKQGACSHHGGVYIWWGP